MMQRLAICFTLLLAAPVGAQPAVPRKTVPYEGSHAFRHLLALFQFKPMTSVADLEQHDPKECVVIVFGDLRPLGDIQRITGLRRFVDNGGALLIATRRDDEGRLQELGWQVDGNTINMPDVSFGGERIDANAAPRRYRDEPGCPLIAGYFTSRHALFQNLNKGLATNQPSAIRRTRDTSSLKALAFFPVGAHELGPWILKERIVFMAGTDGGNKEGRCLILGGHCVFMNCMLGQNDNDNFEFARNCVRWLSGDGQRKYVLFVEEGKLQSDFDVPLAELPVPPPRILSKIVRALEEAKLQNDLIDGIGRGRVAYFLLAMASLALLCWTAWRLAKGRRPTEGQVPILEPGAANRVPLLVRRQRELAEVRSQKSEVRDQKSEIRALTPDV